MPEGRIKSRYARVNELSRRILRGQENVMMLMRMNESLSLLLAQYLGLRDPFKKLLELDLHQPSCIFKVRDPVWIPLTLGVGLFVGEVRAKQYLQGRG